MTKMPLPGFGLGTSDTRVPSLFRQGISRSAPGITPRKLLLVYELFATIARQTKKATRHPTGLKTAGKTQLPPPKICAAVKKVSPNVFDWFRSARSRRQSSRRAQCLMSSMACRRAMGSE